MKKIVASKKWLITYLIILFILFCIDAAGIALVIYSASQWNTGLLSIGIVVLAYMLPCTGIILFYLNRRACLVWTEGDSIRRKGLLFGYKETIKASEVSGVGITYDHKKIYVIAENGSDSHYHAKSIELENSTANMELLKSFWKGEIFESDGENADLTFEESMPESDKTEPVLWQFSPGKFRTLCHALKYMSIEIVVFLLLGFILALADMLSWKGFFILFGGAAAITYLIGGIALLRQERTVYTVTETKVMISYPAMNCVSDFANIKDIKISRSLFHKNVGTIKFRVKKGFNINYQFAKIDDVDRVYNLLISLWKA